MRPFKKPAFSLLLILGLFAPAAYAGGKEDPHDLLSRTFQQSDIWNQGPVKLVAQVRMPTPTGQDLNLQYTVAWAGPDRWNAKWSAQGLEQVTVLSNGKLSFLSNQPSPLVRAIEFEAALAALDGGTPAGPYSFAPLDYQKAKIDVSKKKINGMDAKCLAFGQPLNTFCIDPATGHLLSADGELGTFEYSDYITVDNNSYPQTVKVSYGKTLLEDAKLTVTRGGRLPEALFTPSDKSAAMEFATCAEVDKNFAAPRLTKTAPPKMSDAARKARKYGLVWVLATVGKDGSVVKATVIGGDPDLNSAATDAVKEYKFTPYTRCGQAVEFSSVQIVRFTPPAQQGGDPIVTR